MGRTTLFPASRELFKLIRAIADNSDSIDRMSDVDIGRIIGFESPRTSRWKYGQIAVTDAARLIALCQFFDIDLALLANVAASYLSADDAMEIVNNERKLIRFLGEQLVLPEDGQMLSFTGKDGVSYRLVQRRKGQHDRKTKKMSSGARGDEKEEPVVLLADDDKNTIDVFRNLTAHGTGVTGVVARSGPEALVAAGRLLPRLIIFDLFLGGADGFAALKSLAADEATGEAEIYASSLSLSPDIMRAATGCGVISVLKRPLESRALSRLIGGLRRRG
jgi:CheY-like chemotaxis protein